MNKPLPFPIKTSNRPLDFVVNGEPFGTYTLEDGTELRVRTILMKVLFKGFDPDGRPQYDLSLQQCIDVTPGEHVKQEDDR